MGIVRNREKAQEVVSDVFFRVYDKIDTYRAASSFSTWLYRIAYNAAVSSVRKKDIATVDSPVEILSESLSDDVLEKERNEELICRMEHALTQLGVSDSTLVRLYYYEDKSVAEIAHIMYMSQSNVKTRLHRIRVWLKKRIENELEQ